VDKVLGTVVVFALISTALTLMALSWQRRQRRDIALGIASAGGDRGVSILSLMCFYVATTPANNPLERLGIPGLAFRARARVSIETTGVVIEPQGEIATVISLTQVQSVREASVAIDRSAGRNSLTALDWTASNGQALTSFFRMPRRGDRQLFIAGLSQLVNAQTNNRPSTDVSTKESAQ
jgi:hypothetical protein